jgi:hypothetical protein
MLYPRFRKMKNLSKIFLAMICMLPGVFGTEISEPCILCSEQSFSLKQFACDEKCDADADSPCGFCEQKLDIGQRICKIELSEPIYFHNNCLTIDAPLCSSCLKTIENKLIWKERIKKIKNCSLDCFSNSAKCLTWTAIGLGSIYILYYFTMGPGNKHYCPCLMNMSFSEKSSCDFSKYPGCNIRIQ